MPDGSLVQISMAADSRTDLLNWHLRPHCHSEPVDAAIGKCHCEGTVGNCGNLNAFFHWGKGLILVIATLYPIARIELTLFSRSTLAKVVKVPFNHSEVLWGLVDTVWLAVSS